MISSESIQIRPIADDWLTMVQSRLPEGSTAVLTIERLSRHMFHVAFRASVYGETFISECRSETLEDGLREAGVCICERLRDSPPRMAPEFGDRVRRLFRITG